jgi:hypothetical protein
MAESRPAQLRRVGQLHPGVPVTAWERARQALAELALDDRARLCRQILTEIEGGPAAAGPIDERQLPFPL